MKCCTSPKPKTSVYSISHHSEMKDKRSRLRMFLSSLPQQGCPRCRPNENERGVTRFAHPIFTSHAKRSPRTSRAAAYRGFSQSRRSSHRFEAPGSKSSFKRTTANSPDTPSSPAIAKLLQLPWSQPPPNQPSEEADSVTLTYLAPKAVLRTTQSVFTTEAPPTLCAELQRILNDSTTLATMSDIATPTASAQPAGGPAFDMYTIVTTQAIESDPPNQIKLLSSEQASEMKWKCAICFDERSPHPNMPYPVEIFDDSQDRVCTSCLRNIFMRAMSHEDECPARWNGRTGPLLNAEALEGHVLSTEEVKAYKHRVLEVETKPRDRIYCGCGSFVYPFEERTRASFRHFQRCLDKSCRKWHCAKCGMGFDARLRSRDLPKKHGCSAHLRNRTKGRTEEMGGLLAGKDFQLCPGCGRPVQLAAACNQITCHCGQKFCYLCGKKAEDGSGHWDWPGCLRWGHPDDRDKAESDRGNFGWDEPEVIVEDDEDDEETRIQLRTDAQTRRGQARDIRTEMAERRAEEAAERTREAESRHEYAVERQEEAELRRLAAAFRKEAAARRKEAGRHDEEVDLRDQEADREDEKADAEDADADAEDADADLADQEARRADEEADARDADAEQEDLEFWMGDRDD